MKRIIIPHFHEKGLIKDLKQTSKLFYVYYSLQELHESVKILSEEHEAKRRQMFLDSYDE